MAKHEVGDRVKVEFEATVTHAIPGADYVTLEDDRWSCVVPNKHITKIVPPMPTKPGTLLRQRFQGSSLTYQYHHKGEDGQWRTFNSEGMVFLGAATDKDLESSWHSGQVTEVN